MAKQIEYPRASLKNCLELADAVDSLGGGSSVEMAADKLNKKVSGAFSALVASAVRYDLISSKKGQLKTSGLYREIKLAYSKEERTKALTKAFLTPPLFSKLFERFEGKELPISHFEKLLIREFDVPEDFSSRVSKYFTDGAKLCEILDSSNNLVLSSTQSISDIQLQDDVVNDGLELDSTQPSARENVQELRGNSAPGVDDSFSVRIKGPGMDSTIEIFEEEDLVIVQAMLNKVKKRLESRRAEIDLE